MSNRSGTKPRQVQNEWRKLSSQPKSRATPRAIIGLAVRLVSGARAGLIQPGILAGLFQKRPCCLDVPPCCKTKINQLAMLIDSTPEVAPFAANSNIGLVHMPVQTSPRSVLESSFRNLWAEFTHPSMDRGRIHLNPSLSQQISHVAVR